MNKLEKISDIPSIVHFHFQFQFIYLGILVLSIQASFFGNVISTISYNRFSQKGSS